MLAMWKFFLVFHTMKTHKFASLQFLHPFTLSERKFSHGNSSFLLSINRHDKAMNLPQWNGQEKKKKWIKIKSFSAVRNMCGQKARDATPKSSFKQWEQKMPSTGLPFAMMNAFSSTFIIAEWKSFECYSNWKLSTFSLSPYSGKENS